MPAKLKLAKLKFAAGGSGAAQPLEIDCPPVTILVGPNNAGKSLTLREIEAWVSGQDVQLRVLDTIVLETPSTFAELMELLRPFRAERVEDQETRLGHFWLTRPITRGSEQRQMAQVREEDLQHTFEQQSDLNKRGLLYRFLVTRLDGRTRFELVDPKPTGDLKKYPQNLLSALFQDASARQRVREFTSEAFGSHYVIDPTGMRLFQVRMSTRAPTSVLEEQALDNASRQFHEAAIDIAELGDGVKASVGLVSAVLGLPDSILLLDEPEAFLHPTLARRLGRVLAEATRSRDASLVISTHSSEFLMGCIQASPDIRIVRLTFERSQASARSIDAAEITALMNDPLLRSANALRALFHRGVIVTEADADRAFYEEVNYRLSRVGRGVEDVLFLNAQNWQTIPRLLRPLRKLGVPAAGIIDIDALRDKDFKHLWPLLNVDAPTLTSLQTRRAEVKVLMDGVGKAACKSKGVAALDAADQPKLRSLIDEFEKYGLFFVPTGELECWLPVLMNGVGKSDKGEWLTTAFDRMGVDPSALGYVKPGPGDVWGFVEKVKKWIDNPNRLGILA